MLKYRVTRRLLSRRRARRHRDNRKRACRLTVETLEDRLVLSGDMVLRWNEVLFATVQAASPPNPVAGRAAAIVQAAVYDAVNSIDGTHTPYAGLPGVTRSYDSFTAAANEHWMTDRAALK